MPRKKITAPPTRLPRHDEVAPGIKRPDWQPPARFGDPLTLPPLTDDRTRITYETMWFDNGMVIHRAVPSDRKDPP